MKKGFVMNKTRKQAINHRVFIFIGLLVALFAVEVTAMKMSPEGRAMAQKEWKRQQAKIQEAKEKEEQQRLRKVQKQIVEQRTMFFDSMKNNSYFTEFNQQLQQDNISKGWFQGPSKAWQTKIILLAFEILEPYRNKAKYASNFDELRSYIVSALCNAIHDYDKLCYLHLYDPHVCNEIITKLDNLVQYSMSPTKKDPTFINMLMLPNIFESQVLYEQLLEQRKQK